MMTDECKWSYRSNDEIMRDMKELHKDVPVENPNMLIMTDITNTGKATLAHIIAKLKAEGIVIVNCDTDGIQGIDEYDKAWIDEMNKVIDINAAAMERVEPRIFGKANFARGRRKAQWKREIKGRK